MFARGRSSRSKHRVASRSSRPKNSVEPGVAHGGQGIVDGRLSGALLGDLLVSVLDSADDDWSKYEEDKIDRAETTTPEKKPRPGYFV